MTITGIFSLMGGLALFLYGMHMMSRGLENAAGNRLKNILEKLTKTPVLGVLVGMFITALIQSSSATTVMVVGFVNSKLMEITQAVWIIMGANIGTTITGQLVALDIGALAPLIALIGVAAMIFFKKKNIIYTGEIIAGLGILFIGMNMMSDAMMPLRDNPQFVALMTQFKNPLLGILAGAVFTAVIQSSSASVGILQALAMSGAISFESSVFILFGQNIGTCITAVLAAIGADRNAKRTTVIHLTFNIIGTVIFTTVCLLFPVAKLVAGLSPDNPMAQIANMHTLFNVATTVLLFPFGKKLAAFSKFVLPDKPEKEGHDMVGLSGYVIGSTAIGIEKLHNELDKMYTLAKDNVEAAFISITDFTKARQSTILEREEKIDVLNAEITRFIVKLTADEISYKEMKTINSMLKITGNIERIGDHALNLSEYGENLKRRGLTLTDEAEELKTLQELIHSSMEHIRDIDTIQKNEDEIDSLRVLYRDTQIKRIQDGRCSAEACVIYNEILTDIERVSDHLVNISQENRNVTE